MQNIQGVLIKTIYGLYSSQTADESINAKTNCPTL